MKKLQVLILAALFLIMSGCSDASANISDGNTALFKVGGETVTKENVYTYAKASMAGDGTSMLVKKGLLDAEVPATEDMEKEAKKTLSTIKENFGSNFTDMLKTNGYSDEDTYYNEVVLVNIQTQELTKKYLNEENKITDYQPLKLQMVIATSEDKAKDALAAIKGGTSFSDAASKYGDTAKSKGNETIYSTASGLSSTVWTQILNLKEGTTSEVIADTTNNLYYVIKAVKTNVEDYKEDAVDALSAVSSVSSAAFIYYLEKHDFRVWDIDVYNQIKTNNPSYLVQDN